MLKIGLTGGIGAGKTIVTKIFHQLGVPIFYADEEAKRLMEVIPQIAQEVMNLLGSQAYNNGKLNRAFIAERIFKEDALREQINDLVHPHVMQSYVNWLASLDGTPYCIKEAAILIETGSHQQLDKIISVTAPIELRIKRTMKRDPSKTPAMIRDIMEKQLSDKERIAMSDYVIKNDDSKLVISQVVEIHKVLHS